MDVLPDNVLLHIFCHMNYESLCLGVRLTCQRFRWLSHDGELWRCIIIPEHFHDVRFLMLLSQVHLHVEDLDCSRCEDLTHEGFERLAELQFPRLRNLAVPIVNCFKNLSIFEKLAKSCPELMEVENIYSTVVDPIQPLRCQAFFPKLRVIHDKPVSTYGRIRKLIAPMLANDKKIEWENDLKALVQKCPDVLSYRCRRGFEYLDDAGLEVVSKLLPDLRFLELHYTSITDEGIVKFFQHNKASIKEIILDKPGEITDKALQVIADNCEDIETLQVRRCIQITNKGIMYVASKCKKLREFHLNNTIYAFDETTTKRCDISNACLQEIGLNCPSLTYFRVFYSNVVSIQGLQGIQGCRFLQGLMLYDCPGVDDACLEAIRELPFLKALVLVNSSGITPTGVTDLILCAPFLLRLTLFISISNNESFFGDMSDLAEEIFDKIGVGYRPSVLKKLTLKGVGGAFIQLITVLCPLLHTLDIRENSVMTSNSVNSVIRNCEDLQTLDCQSISRLDDSFVDTLCEYSYCLRKLTLGAMVCKLSNESLVKLLATCPSLTTLSMDTHDTHINEDMLIATAKKYHGGLCFMFVDTECRGIKPEINHRFIELHFTAIKYVGSISPAVVDVTPISPSETV